MTRLTVDLRVAMTRVADLVKAAVPSRRTRRFGWRGISTPSPRFWLNLQSAYDLEKAEDELLVQIERDVRPLAARAASR